ncbi:hypothetical protein FHL81_06985 [Agrobacterium tumefaciens]|nr:hypothetical protein FHL81_06985 [Agrobacterium tumefaciens]KAB0458401.1 hypothetical protein F7R04_16590 [Agrobacterium tumefaciens]TGE82862.1 hypothetical protein C9410_04605 [Rhizobium sp. SEMIA 439]
MEKLVVIGRSSKYDGAIGGGRGAVLAGNCRACIHPLETAVRINDERGEGHGEDRHEKREDCQSADQLCHVHSPLLELMDRVLPHSD